MGTSGLDAGLLRNGCLPRMYGGSVRSFFPIYKWLVRYRYFLQGLSYWVDACWYVRQGYLRKGLLTGCVVLYIAFVFDFYSYVDPSIVSFSYIETFTVAVFICCECFIREKAICLCQEMRGDTDYSWGYLYPCSEECLCGSGMMISFIPRFLLWVSLLFNRGAYFLSWGGTIISHLTQEKSVRMG